jgi:hypothetical protein
MNDAMLQIIDHQVEGASKGTRFMGLFVQGVRVMPVPPP